MADNADLCSRCGHAPRAVYRRICNSCHNEKRRAHKLARPKNTAAQNQKWRLRGYGLTQERYEEMVFAQGGSCACCDRLVVNSKDLHIDHDHDCCPGKKSCGKCVRGLLCQRCNMALGLFGDDPAALRGAIEYLERTAVTHG